ncbi:MAG TPA: response regulator [Pseudobdellovibrionaceae bacterium]|jgi:CheY-like chemotaxis protein
MALRVLLADESSTIKRVMQLALQDFGVEVKSVPVGVDVLPISKTFKPDVIFADVLLAKRNGYEVCAELKADPETKHIPVILMWSSFMEVDEPKISAANPDARLEKPFDAETLRQIVQTLAPKTQSNPISPYLQFPKMPEFNETPVSTQASAKPSLQPLTSPEGAMKKPMGKIPEVAPINFDQFDPTTAEENIFSIPEEDTYSGISHLSHETPEQNLRAVATDEEFASVPLNSSQQKDPLEEDGWQRQDLKKFKIQPPVEATRPALDERADEEDFAKKFVIPQEASDNDSHPEAEGEFEEIQFGEDLTSTRIGPPMQTKASPKVSTKSMLPPGVTTDVEMIERVIRDEAREVIESICWKVIPEIAERIVREEIHKILRDVEKSN